MDLQWLAVIDGSPLNITLPKQVASQLWGSSKSNFIECWAAQAVQTRWTTPPLTATWCSCQISWISIRSQKWRTMALASGRPPIVPADSSWRNLGTCQPSGDLVEHHVMFARSNFYGQGQAAIQCKAIQLTQTYMAWPAIHCFTSIFILGLKEKQPCVACFLPLTFKYLSSNFRTHSSKHLQGTNRIPCRKPQQFCQPLYLDILDEYWEYRRTENSQNSQNSPSKKHMFKFTLRLRPIYRTIGRSRLQPVQSVCSFTWTTERHGKFKKAYLDLANRKPQSQGISAFFSHDIVWYVWYILISSLAEKWRQAKMFWNGLGPEIWWDLIRSGSSFLVQNRQWLLCATAANVNAMSDVNQVGCQIF